MIKDTFRKIRSLYKQHGRVVNNLLKWMILIVALYFVFHFFDFLEVKDIFSSIPIYIFLCYIGILLSSRILYALRWQLINRSIANHTTISLWVFIKTNLLAEFLSIALPSSISGEVVRFMKINLFNKDGTHTTLGIFIDRLTGISTMMLVSIISLIITGNQFNVEVGQLIPEELAIPIIIVVVIIIGLSLFFLFYWLRKKNYLKRISSAVDFAKNNYHLFLSAGFISIFGHILFAVSHYVLFKHLFPISVLSVIGVILTPQLARSIPISFLGVGGGEGLMVVSQLMIGLPEAIAITITFISLFARYIFALIGFLIELFTDGVQFLKELSPNKDKM